MSTEQPEALSLADALSNLSQGRDEWRVQDPVTKSYCLNSERESDVREWFDDYRTDFPGGRYTGYEVAKVRAQTKLEIQAEQAAAELRRLHAVNAQLLEALQAIVKTLADQDDEGLIEHAQQMIDARAAIAKAKGDL